MLIKTLVENRTCSPSFKPKHGLSLYVKTNKHQLLFDVGSTTLFLDNAKKLGVDIKDIDILIISHGHLDHGGALEYFFEVNKKATVYLQDKALDEHFILDKENNYSNVSLKINKEDLKRVIFVKNYLKIDDELSLVSNVRGHRCYPSNNKRLYKKENGIYINDDFEHEEHLLIQESKTLLISGCCHNGLVNVLDHLKELELPKPDLIISGLHLLDPISKISEDDDFIKEYALELKKYDIPLYTCHCTGYENYLKLKEILGAKINYLATGEVIEL